MLQRGTKEWVSLTADVGAAEEGLGHLLVELNEEVLLDGELLVPVVAAGVHPGLERHAHQGVDDRADIGPRHFADLAQDGKGVDDGRVAEAEVKDCVHLEGLVLGHVDHLCVLAGDGLKKS